MGITYLYQNCQKGFFIEREKKKEGLHCPKYIKTNLREISTLLFIDISYWKKNSAENFRSQRELSKLNRKRELLLLMNNKNNF